MPVDHQSDAENWELYQTNVVDFLRRQCQLNDVYSDEEIFHVLGILVTML
jgi:hypothetical protein